MDLGGALFEKSSYGLEPLDLKMEIGTQAFHKWFNEQILNIQIHDICQNIEELKYIFF